MSAVLKFPVFPESDHSESVYVVDPARAAAASRTQRRLTVVEKAAADAEAIVQAARAQAESIKRQAEEQGYKEGTQRAEAGLAERTEELENLAQSILDERDSLIAQLEPQVVKLSVEIAEKILRRELSADSEAVLVIVKAALRQLREAGTVRLRVNPADKETVSANCDVLRECVDGIRDLRVVEDRRVDQGGCVAESSAGGIDARISSQLTEVKRVLQEAGGHDAGDTQAGSDQVFEDSQSDEHAAA